MTRLFKLIVHIPLSHADAMRQAVGDAGGGQAGPYSHCSFSVRGTGRFKVGYDANPHIGTPGSYDEVEEECIEVSHIALDVVADVIQAMQNAHPYEETAYQLFEMVNVEDLKG